MSASASPVGGDWFEIRDRAVYLPAVEVLVLADLHLGQSRTSNIELPLPESGPIGDRLERLLSTYEPEAVVFAGDVCHAFDRVPNGVADAVTALTDRVEASGASPVFLRGNHDTMLGELVGAVTDEYQRDEILICHGHEEPDATARRYVIGHDHPAIEIEGRRYPCYLWGPGSDRDAEILVLPAFSDLVTGTLVNGRVAADVQSPLIRDLAAFRPIVHDEDQEDPLVFPPLSELRPFLE